MKQTLKARLQTPLGALELSARFRIGLILLMLIFKFFVLRARTRRGVSMSKKTPATVINRLFRQTTGKKQFLIFCRSDIGS
jgi:hypothetical protein